MYNKMPMPWPGAQQAPGMMPMPMPTPLPATMPTMQGMPTMQMMPTMQTMPTMQGLPIQTMPNGSTILPGGTTVPTPSEESYVENILRMNLGKTATLYMTYENNSEWNAKIFKGVLEAAGRDHIIISDPATGKRYLLLMLNLDYITFDEPLNYTLPFGTAGASATGR